MVAEVRDELAARIATAVAAGIDERHIVIDPGIGFAKTAAHNWTLLARLDELAALGRPMLVGTSRKSFLGRLLATPDPSAPLGSGGTSPRPVDDRDDATQATTAVLALQGVWAVRVHSVRPAADAVRVAAALRAAASARRSDSSTRRRPARRDGHVARAARTRSARCAARGDRARSGILIDAALEVHTRRAAEADDLSATADYGLLAARLTEVVTGEPWR